MFLYINIYSSLHVNKDHGYFRGKAEGCGGSHDPPLKHHLQTMSIWLWLTVGSTSLFLTTQAALECDCNTKECEALGMTSCFADKFCFAENFNNRITRGCLDGRTPLLCENWRPKKLNTPWPVVFCCDNDHHCNKGVKPTDPTVYVQGTTVQIPTLHPVEGNADDQVVKNSDCEKSETNSSVLRNSGVNKMLNPIYIAVPVAGVCVLLALIIFAMYLLRRRNDYYHHYHYPDHPQHLAQLPCDPKKPGGTTCSSVNRCTDSERSSSGSETKLFLQV